MTNPVHTPNGAIESGTGWGWRAEDEFYCNAATVVRSAAEKNSSATSL